jgi:hypothetical protein
MRYLWLVSAAIILAGGVFLAMGLSGLFGPLALVGGLLLVWSGIVKVIVLRIWRGGTPRLDSSSTGTTTEPKQGGQQRL